MFEAVVPGEIRIHHKVTMIFHRRVNSDGLFITVPFPPDLRTNSA
jgi:hypothetical protein